MEEILEEPQEIKLELKLSHNYISDSFDFLEGTWMSRFPRNTHENRCFLNSTPADASGISLAKNSINW